MAAQANGLHAVDVPEADNAADGGEANPLLADALDGAVGIVLQDEGVELRGGYGLWIGRRSWRR